MKVAIYGSSSTGKTTIAVSLARELEFDLRSCGEEIKKKAKKLNVRIDDITDKVHRTIDNETVQWVKSNDNCIVEGRFLDSVLSEVSDSIFLVKLTATDKERCERMKKRGHTNCTTDDLSEIDKFDGKFRKEHYICSKCIVPVLTIDTSSFSVEQCINQIKIRLQGLVAQHD